MSRRRSRPSASSNGARQPRNRASRDHKSPYRTLLRRSDVDGSKALPRLVMASGVIGGAFALGLLFGDHAISGGPSALDGGLAKIDELTGEYEQVRDQLELTFHKELTEAEKAVEASRTRRDQVASGMKDALPVLSASDNPLHSKPDDEPDSDGANKPSTTTPTATKPASVEPVAKTAQMTEPKPAPDVVDDENDEDEGATKKPAVVAGSRKRLASALSSLLGEETPDWAQKLSTDPKDARAKKAAAARAPTASGAVERANSDTVAKAPAKGSYYLQVASSPNADGADRLRAKLAADGHRASVRKADVGGRTMHRVVIVGFADKDAASRARDKVASAHGLKGLVRSAR